jgi:hypothetical protein
MTPIISAASYDWKILLLSDDNFNEVASRKGASAQTYRQRFHYRNMFVESTRQRSATF